VLDALLRDGRAQDVTEQGLATLGVERSSTCRGVEVEALVLRAKLRLRERRTRLRCAAPQHRARGRLAAHAREHHLTRFVIPEGVQLLVVAERIGASEQLLDSPPGSREHFGDVATA